MTRSAILATLLAVTVLVGCRKGGADDESKEEEKPPAIVFIQERSTTEDVIYLNNDKELRGEVLDASLSLATPYGELSIDVGRCARMAFFETEAEEKTGKKTKVRKVWSEVVIGVNGDRITGTVTDLAIRFRDASTGEETEVQKKNIWFIAFQKNANEPGQVDVETAGNQFIMANGDLLHGRAAQADLMIQADSGAVSVPFDEMALVRVSSEEVEDENRDKDADGSTEPAEWETTAIVEKRNGDIVSGSLSTENLTLHLDCGIVIEEIASRNFWRYYAGEGDGAANSIGMEMVTIPAGEFTMGSPEDEERRDDDETQRRVTLTGDFQMSATEVTQSEWGAVMGKYPSEFKGGLLPVENVSWEEAIEFCNALSTIEGLPVAYKVEEVDDREKISLLDGDGEPTTDIRQVKGYRLPTDAEWEYACRAGTTTVFNTGDAISTDQANFDGRHPYGDQEKGEESEMTVRVGKYPPNAWGLYDMHGNVWEWCHDLYGTYSTAPVTDPIGAVPSESRHPRTARVLRGGGWSGGPEYCRSAYRAWSSPTSSDRYLGFRVVVNAN